uniref:Coiled-coil-helix-coiled-coil-helix domain containing 3a n=1 Tax=Neogobius melanostomus TaxID=47308 RepID=A0A8C6UG83_9GOBI
MGANNSTRRVSFESDENENITVVKGIRVEVPTVIDVVLPISTPMGAAKAVPAPASQPIEIPPPPPPTAPASPSSPAPTPATPEPIAPLPIAETIVSPSPEPPMAESTTAPVQSEPVSLALRKKIIQELSKGLEKDRVKAEQELQGWLESEKARASAHAQATAQSQVKDEVSRVLSVDRVAAQDNLQQAIVRERIASEDEKRRVQLYAKQLEAIEADLQRRDIFYRDQVARLEERSAQFYKVTTENYHKAADEVNAKYKRYEVYPVCAELQGQILACYRENAGKTLHCSNIAALYLQCVNKAKMVSNYPRNKRGILFLDQDVFLL